MKLIKILMIILAACLLFASAASARDFSWTRDFNLEARTNPAEFKIRFAERFDLSDLQVTALFNIFRTPADAYIMLRFGEMQGMLKTLSKDQAKVAVQKYRLNRKKGWEAMAEILGVDPGSDEFLALKNDHDLHGEEAPSQVMLSSVDDNDSSSSDGKNYRAGMKN